MSYFKNINFKTDLLPFLIATIGEFVALHYWLSFMAQDQMVWACILLWVGFGIERGSVAFWLQKVYLPQVGFASTAIPLWQRLLGWTFITFTEIVIWVIWYKAIGPFGHLWAGAILYVLMLLEHSAEMALVKQKSMWMYAGKFKTHFYTLMETLGAMGWMYFFLQGQMGWAVACLLIGLSIEHIIQGGGLKPKPEEVQAEAVEVV